MGNPILSLLDSVLGGDGKPKTKIITVASDFPTLIEANAYIYDLFIFANAVTDNDLTKTNTGESFLSGQEAVWNSATASYVILGDTAMWGDDLSKLSPLNARDVNIASGKIYKINNENIFTRINTEISTFNKGIFAAINELNAFPNKVFNDISYFCNATPTQTLATSGAGDLATKIATLVDGDILEIQTDASYSAITIPISKRIAIRVKKGHDVELNSAQAITFANGAANVFLAGFIFDSNPSGTDSKGSAICLEHQAIINDITFYDCTFRNNNHSAVLLSYHQTIGGDDYATANLLSEFSSRIAFVECHFDRAANSAIEGGAIVMRGIHIPFIHECDINGRYLSRGIQLQNCQYCFVAENKVTQAAAGGNGEGIKLDSIGSPTYFNSGIFYKNLVTNCLEGIDIDDVDEALVIQNIVFGCTDEGISLDDSSKGVFLNNVSYNNNYGIRFEVGSVGNLKGNVCFNNITSNYFMENGYTPDNSNTTAISDTFIGADKIPYDNTTSGLAATLVQNAIDEIYSSENLWDRILGVLSPHNAADNIALGTTQNYGFQQPANATFYAKYISSINGDYGLGNLAGTAIGGAAIAGGKLDLAHDDVRYVSYDALNNANFQQAGTIRFKLTPNYSGTPATAKSFFSIAKGSGLPDRNNLILLVHNNGSGNNHLYCYITDSADAWILNGFDFGAWAPVAGTEYEFELDIDITTGATRLFINGIQFGSTATSAGIRDSNIGILMVGQATHVLTFTSDFSISDFIVFNSVQHTSNYTPGYTLQNIKFSTLDTAVNNLLVYGSSTLVALSVANGIVQTTANGLLSSSTALPNGTTATTQVVGDNTTKTATDAFVQAEFAAQSPAQLNAVQRFVSPAGTDAFNGQIDRKKLTINNALISLDGLSSAEVDCEDGTYSEALIFGTSRSRRTIRGTKGSDRTIINQTLTINENCQQSALIDLKFDNATGYCVDINSTLSGFKFDGINVGGNVTDPVCMRVRAGGSGFITIINSDFINKIIQLDDTLGVRYLYINNCVNVIINAGTGWIVVKGINCVNVLEMSSNSNILEGWMVNGVLNNALEYAAVVALGVGGNGYYLCNYTEAGVFVTGDVILRQHPVTIVDHKHYNANAVYYGIYALKTYCKKLGSWKEIADDATVVHNSGDETIAGIKTFSSFPISPSSAPSADYQFANKKYVDDAVGGENLWDELIIPLAYTVVTPHTATDRIQVPTITGGSGSIFYADLDGNKTLTTSSNFIWNGTGLEFSSAAPYLKIYKTGVGVGSGLLSENLSDTASRIYHATGTLALGNATLNIDASPSSASYHSLMRFGYYTTAASINFDFYGSVNTTAAFVVKAYTGVTLDSTITTDVNPAAHGFGRLCFIPTAGGSVLDIDAATNGMYTSLIRFGYNSSSASARNFDFYGNGSIESLTIAKVGTVKSITNFLTLTNKAQAADMDGTITAIQWNQYANDSVTYSSGSIYVETETDWTSVAGTRDSKMVFQTVLDGVMANALSLASNKDVTIYRSLTMAETADTMTPVSGYGSLYFNNDGSLAYTINHGGVTRSPFLLYAGTYQTTFTLNATLATEATQFMFSYAGNPIWCFRSLNVTESPNNRFALSYYAAGYNDFMSINTEGKTSFINNMAIRQNSGTAAIEVLTLTQADESEGFINFAGSARGAIVLPVNSVDSFRVELNGVVGRVAVFADA